MKRLLAALLALAALLSLTACSADFAAKAAFTGFDGLLSSLGRQQLTDSRDLIGSRRLTGGDGFDGTYSASCSGESGRDVIFGGASLCQRRVLLTVSVATDSGEATVRIRLGDTVNEYGTDCNSSVELTLDVCGGSYIMVDYNNFCGRVTMSCSPIEQIKL